jgi:mRNA interferase MazF
VRRGDVVTVAAGGGYGGKPRPAVVIQSDRFDATDSVTLCLCTTDPVDAPLIRLAVQPSAENGLRERSWLMVDKVVSVRRTRLGEHAGHLAAEDIVRINRALMVFLGLAG